LRLLLPMIWSIPREFPAFGDGLFLRHAYITKHMRVECCELATLMREGQELANPHAQ